MRVPAAALRRPAPSTGHCTSQSRPTAPRNRSAACRRGSPIGHCRDRPWQARSSPSATTCSGRSARARPAGPRRSRPRRTAEAGCARRPVERPQTPSAGPAVSRARAASPRCPSGPASARWSRATRAGRRCRGTAGARTGRKLRVHQQLPVDDPVRLHGRRLRDGDSERRELSRPRAGFFPRYAAAAKPP